MRYLLDTDTVSDLVRNPQGQIADYIREVGKAQVCTSIIVAAELRDGAARKASIRLTRQVDKVLSVLDVLPFEAPADDVYAIIRSQLERTGRPIGGNDLLIAAHAVALGCTVVTGNTAEFSRVEGLACANWLRHEPR
jgi:tRNA(fMet)-specific endonuclease VapC